MLQISEKDSHLLQEFRERISDILKDEDEYRNSDGFLITWLRHKNDNLSHAEKAIRQHTKWRRDHKIDCIHIHLEIIQDLREAFPYEIHGVDKIGRPVAWVQLAQWNLAALRLKGDADLMQYGHQLAQNLELAIIHQHNKEAEHDGGIVWQFTGICDLANFPYDPQLLNAKVIRLITKFVADAEANWPLRCGSMILINAPRIMTIIYNIIKPFLSKHTKAGVRIYGSNKNVWEEALRKIVETDYIPTNFGYGKDATLNF